MIPLTPTTPTSARVQSFADMQQQHDFLERSGMCMDDRLTMEQADKIAADMLWPAHFMEGQE